MMSTVFPEIKVRLIEKFMKGEMPFTEMMRGLAEIPNPQFLQFALEISEPSSVHLAGLIPGQSFEDFQKKGEEFLTRVRSNLLGPGEDWLSNKQSGLIETLQPLAARPIYFVTLEDDKTKEIVYVGQTSAESGRFIGGHAALTKLNDPLYSHKKKLIYMCALLVRINQDEWTNIEFLPVKYARAMLSSVESQLIFQLDPRFNSIDTKTDKSVRFVILHDNKYSLDKLHNNICDTTGLVPIQA